MGVYIKGMDKPVSCNDCQFSGYDERQSVLFCRVDNEDIEQSFREDCPLQPIDDEQVEKTQNELIKAWTVFQSVFKDEKL